MVWEIVHVHIQGGRVSAPLPRKMQREWETLIGLNFDITMVRGAWIHEYYLRDLINFSVHVTEQGRHELRTDVGDCCIREATLGPRGAPNRRWGVDASFGLVVRRQAVLIDGVGNRVEPWV